MYGNPQLWAKKYFRIGFKGRFITNQKLKLKNFLGIFATGDCAVIGSSKRPSSGIFAVKVLNILATIFRGLKGESLKNGSLKNWFTNSKFLS